MKRCIICFLYIIIVMLSGCSAEEDARPIHKVTSVIRVNSDISTTDTKLISVPNLNQNPTLPTGCEATAAVMVLQYYKEDISILDFAEYCLPKCNEFYQQNGILYGPDPSECFVGDPFSRNGYGCFSSVIVDAVNNNSRLCRAERVGGKLEELCRQYIDKDKPLLIWATIDMKPLKEGDSWRLSTGEAFRWPSGEHCLVLVGYDRFNYYFNDPLKGNTVGYEKEIVADLFAALGSQAVLIEACN